MTQEIVDLGDPAFQADPHPAYASWRRTGPVRRARLPSGLPAWVITRYDDARRALADPRLSKRSYPMGSGLATGQGRAATGAPAVGGSRTAGAASAGDLAPGIGAAISQHMLAVDPPDHTRLRRLVSAAFTARRIEALRPRIEQIATELLDAIDGETEADLIDAFAFPLPIQVICELLGVPVEDRDDFRDWSNAVVAGSQAGPRLAPAIEAMVRYIHALIAERRAEPGDDLLSGLIQVRDARDRLTEQELSSMVFLLLVAGHETTVNLIGNGVYLLLRDRAGWERLRADRALLPGAIEEFLRYEGPVETATFRIATEDVEIGGVTIPAGDPVVVVLLSANRDADHFPHADELRLDRPPAHHLAFGHGIHYCLGAPLARLEAQIAFTALLDRHPDLRLGVPVHQLRWRPGLVVRGLERLPVVL
ncbi:cytochrome P450 family protein [Actinoplanes teichomyceticus]|uniref:Cytochrome P450 n=1 Tax=Actinoplanes teichomyceticus TaxID=1867 RepID=A0A561VGD9_ACTTI|nr:cytochrome P450 [Actinoplanes teichomyceticus]TWG10669.1 cytochrome P450 [Actinoplanes teichomyceticus]GIF15438.1 cytochrome P450 [Actinoplanes teichomyceticus]